MINEFIVLIFSDEIIVYVSMYFKIYFFSKLIGTVGIFHVFEKKNLNDI